MRKPILFFFSFLLYTFLFVQCGKPPLPISMGKVYVAGGEAVNVDTDSVYGIAKLWVDGKPYDLPSDAQFPQAEEVFADKSDVYVAGTDFDSSSSRAVLWKNMRPIYLSKQGEYGQALSLFVTNKDVYVIGSVTRNGVFKPVIWKNGVETYVNDEIVFLFSLFVYNNDVYAAGLHKVNGVNYPAIYKNNQPHQVLEVPAGYQFGEVECVYVHKGIVYAAGYTSGPTGSTAAVLWINGQYTKLEGSFNVRATGVTVSSTNDVYVTGVENSHTVVWRNGKLLYSDNLESGSAAFSIAVSGKDVYVAGHYSANGATLWKNNIPQVLPVRAGFGYAFSVFVK